MRHLGMTVVTLLAAVHLSTNVASAATSEKFRIQVGAGPAAAAIKTGIGFLGSFGFRVSPRVLIGGELAFNIGAGGVAGFTPITMPILGTVVYQFAADGSVHPYIGLSIGPSISISNASTTFGMLLRPGLSFAINNSMDFALEGRFGAFDGIFFINPLANLAFKL